MNEVAEQLGRPQRRFTLPLPDLPIGISQLPDALAAALIPERARLAANLLESLRHDSDVRDDAALRAFEVQPRGLRAAVAAALANA